MAHLGLNTSWWHRKWPGPLIFTGHWCHTEDFTTAHISRSNCALSHARTYTILVPSWFINPCDCNTVEFWIVKKIEIHYNNLQYTFKHIQNPTKSLQRNLVPFGSHLTRLSPVPIDSDPGFFKLSRSAEAGGNVGKTMPPKPSPGHSQFYRIPIFCWFMTFLFYPRGVNTWTT